MQEQTDKILTTDKVKLADGKVKPNSKVKIKWTDSKYHPANAEEEVHPSLAAKLIEKGAAVLVNAKDAEVWGIGEAKKSAGKGGKKEEDKS